MHKWRPKVYSFVYVLMRLTSLALKQHFNYILSMQTRLVRLISTRRKEYFLAAIYAFVLYFSPGARGPRLFSVTVNYAKVYSCAILMCGPERFVKSLKQVVLIQRYSTKNWVKLKLLKRQKQAK